MQIVIRLLMISSDWEDIVDRLVNFNLKLTSVDCKEADTDINAIFRGILLIWIWSTITVFDIPVLLVITKMSSSKGSSERIILVIVAGVFLKRTQSCSLKTGDWSERSIRLLLSLWALLLVDCVLCREDTIVFVLLLMLSWGDRHQFVMNI